MSLSQDPSSKDSKGRGLKGIEEPAMLVLDKEKQQATMSQNVSLGFSFPEPPPLGFAKVYQSAQMLKIPELEGRKPPQALSSPPAFRDGI